MVYIIGLLSIALYKQGYFQGQLDALHGKQTLQLVTNTVEIVNLKKL